MMIADDIASRAAPGSLSIHFGRGDGCFEFDQVVRVKTRADAVVNVLPFSHDPSKITKRPATKRNQLIDHHCTYTCGQSGKSISHANDVNLCPTENADG